MRVAAHLMRVLKKGLLLGEGEEGEEGEGGEGDK